ncbi:MAG: hypothetical protein L0229_07150 [Blastocatellia bacterium]|nr:hypothetical protein [Blastocatellia bacterium]
MACVGKKCDFAIDMVTGLANCVTGIGTCTDARLLEAKTSKFHDKTLSDATGKINGILASIPKDAEGRQLAFLLTPDGVFLAWLQHGVVSAYDDEKTIAKALGIKSKKSASRR